MHPSDFLHNLQNVLITQNMVLANALWPVLARDAPYQCMLEALHDQLVDLVAKVLHRAFGPWHDHRVVKIRQLALGLGVHSATHS